ncbi:YciI family protein [Brevibacillus ruminantium]|uniref:YciI family protein n=1 Tax=Brevibacillus ruminantium TaxID=2950604 RepID=A0ABY4WEF9_9BACL|nr:YciI family protein [Brevibacillus ruminantium]USG64337.1 YciI family protein [Brevibacillus ruminantium]
MKKFLVFIERKSDFSGTSIPDHRSYLQELREGGSLVSAGGFPDQTGGAYVLQAETLEEAAAIVHQDPMYLEGQCLYQIKEWNVQ